MSQSVKRAARIIDAIAADPRTVAELAEAFELHRSTMFRELQALEEVGWVRRRASGRYTLGTRLAALSKEALDSLDLREAGAEHVRRLQRRTGNTVHLAALMDRSIVYVDKAEDESGVRMYSRIGRAVIPNCSAVGKAILADLDRAGRDAVLAGVTWERYTELTITTRERLDRELALVRSRGWAADDREFEDFVNCIAVPIRSSLGIVGALSVTAIRMVADLDRLRAHLPAMRETADAIARELG
ncbi:DNA-binding IclR family transcriptional regulator [Agromyces cerinus]|uniref:DNA-binding IclR family transcriptional regulator n=1 Tax=Agromyces hippuratus TaxID=286438 RepID=A0A852X008_9MICO|nr:MULTISPECIES: IclR family transcriptional regulator [Agromyces]MBM7829856.1 DNA-binding IclR family transcriptional regulator [Agromyces cerinus]NYG20684.1 DNA-binding IclR family transcriptional regulator [Agromyces hippuratus]